MKKKKIKVRKIQEILRQNQKNQRKKNWKIKKKKKRKSLMEKIINYHRQEKINNAFSEKNIYMKFLFKRINYLYLIGDISRIKNRKY